VALSPHDLQLLGRTTAATGTGTQILSAPGAYDTLLSTFRTQHVSGVEVLAAGTWNGEVYTVEDLHQLADTYNSGNLGIVSPVKLGHDEDQKLLQEQGWPAAGYITRLWVNGDKLLADFRNVPHLIAELIKVKGYRTVSSEIYFNVLNPATGRRVPRLFKAVALLGGDIPAVNSLREIAALYTRADDAPTTGESVAAVWLAGGAGLGAATTPADFATYTAHTAAYYTAGQPGTPPAAAGTHPPGKSGDPVPSPSSATGSPDAALSDDSDADSAELTTEELSFLDQMRSLVEAMETAVRGRPGVRRLRTFLSASMEQLAAIKPPPKPTPTSTSQEKGHPAMNEQMLALLGLTKDATEAQITAAVQALAEKAKTGTTITPAAGAGDGSHIAALTALIEKQNQTVAALTSQVQSLAGTVQSTQEEAKLSRAEAAVAQAVKDGKVVPATLEWAKKYALENPDGFKAYVESVPAFPLGQEKGKDGEADAGAGGAPAVTAMEKSIAAQLGLSEDKLAASKARNATVHTA